MYRTETRQAALDCLGVILVAVFVGSSWVLRYVAIAAGSRYHCSSYCMLILPIEAAQEAQEGLVGLPGRDELISELDVFCPVVCV